MFDKNTLVNLLGGVSQSTYCSAVNFEYHVKRSNNASLDHDANYLPTVSILHFIPLPLLAICHLSCHGVLFPGAAKPLVPTVHNCSHLIPSERTWSFCFLLCWSGYLFGLVKQNIKLLLLELILVLSFWILSVDSCDYQL